MKSPTVKDNVSALAHPLLEMKRMTAIKSNEEISQALLISDFVGKSSYEDRYSPSRQMSFK